MDEGTRNKAPEIVMSHQFLGWLKAIGIIPPATDKCTIVAAPGKPLLIRTEMLAVGEFVPEELPGFAAVADRAVTVAKQMMATIGGAQIEIVNPATGELISSADK